MSGEGKGFRPDIQGLRAVAVLLVVLNHARVPGFGGGYVGVDVFFVISGFLITGWLLRHCDKGGRIQFGAFYAARARRILPMAALVLVATAVAAKWMLNYVRADGVYHDSLWAAFFAANVHFARVGTDYFAQGNPPSAIQHYWSLAVEEQFYLVWPALLGVTMLVLGRRRILLALPLLAVTGASLAWSIVTTASSPTTAYFSSFTRGWELGIGALLAVGAQWIARIPAWIAALATWSGAAAILVAATTYGAGTEFPGYAALLPVLGAALVVGGGIAGPRRSAELLLGLRPLTYTGDISYSFYLWHWPFLILVAEHDGRTLSIGENLLLLALAYAVSTITYRFFENPLRHARSLTRNSWRALTLWPATVGAVVGVALLGISSVQPSTSSAAVVEPTIVHSKLSDPAAAAVAASVTPGHLAAKINISGLTPSPGALQKDVFPMKGCNAGNQLNTTSPICHWGDTSGTKTMIVFGDSHAQMWLAPLSYFAASNGWQLIPLIKEGCITAIWSNSYQKSKAETPACKKWFAWAANEVQQLSPDAVVFTTSYSPPSATATVFSGQLAEGVTAEIKALAKVSRKLIVLQDTPHLSQDPTDCVLKGGATYGSCTSPFFSTKATVDRAVVSAAKSVSATYLPVLQWFCASGKCPTVVGSTIAYTDVQHISQEYALQLRVPLSNALTAVLK